MRQLTPVLGATSFVLSNVASIPFRSMPSAEWIESNLEPGGDVANRLASAAAAAPQGMPEGEEAGTGQEGGPWLLPLQGSPPPPPPPCTA